MCNSPSAEPQPQAIEGDSDGGLEWLDADGPAPQPSQQPQPDALQPPQPSSPPPSRLQPKQQGHTPRDGVQAGHAVASSSPDRALAPGAAAAPPPAAAASTEAGSTAAEASPARKRGAPRKRRVRVIPKDEGDVEGFDFAVPLQRKQPPAPAAPVADSPAASEPPPAVVAAQVPGPLEQADGRSSPKREADVPAAAEAGTPFGSPAAQHQISPGPPHQQQPPQQSGSQPAAAPAEVRDTDDWGIEIVDVAAADVAAPAEPDSGGRVAAAAVAEATNNARGGAGRQ